MPDPWVPHPPESTGVGNGQEVCADFSHLGHSFIKYLFNAYYVQLVFRRLGYNGKQDSPCPHEVYLLVGSGGETPIK